MNTQSEAKVLVQSLAPFPMESVQGFVLRLAEANGFLETRHLCLVPGVASHIAQMLGDDLSGFVPKWLRGVTRSCVRPDVFAQLFNLGTHARCCPACLSDISYWPVMWEHRFYIACPIHNSLLVDRCPACGLRLSWQRPRILQCRCGSLITGWPRATASAAAIDAAGMLRESMLRSFGDTHDLASHCSVPRNLSLHSIALLLYQLGSLSPSTESFLSPRTWQVLPVEDVQLLIEVAYDLLRDWPIRLHQVLHDDEVLVISNSIKCRHSPAIHRLRRFLFRNLPTDLGFLLDGYRSYHRDISLDLITRRNTWATSDDIEKQRYLAAVNAARRIGIRTSTLHALADLSGVSTVQVGNSGKRRYTLVSQHSLERIKEHLKDKVSLKAAAKLLGLSPGRVEQLVEIGLLHSHQTTSSLARTTFLSRAEISGLVTAIPLVSVGALDTEGTLPLSSISKHFLASRSEFGA